VLVIELVEQDSCRIIYNPIIDNINNNDSNNNQADLFSTRSDVVAVARDRPGDDSPPRDRGRTRS
jgi:hypothetical protein